MALIISSKIYASELEISGSVAGGGNAAAGVRYSISTDIHSGSAGPVFVPSYVNVPGLPAVGFSIVLDDSNYDNIYGRVLLSIDSVVQNVGPPETTTIYLTNPLIQTSTASIYFVAHPQSGDYVATASYTTTFGSNTNAFGNRSFAIGNSTLAVQDDSFSSGIGTVALGTAQTVIGTYNSYNLSDLFIIGNGIDENSRSTILTVSTSSVQITGSVFISSSNFSITTPNLNQIQPSVLVNTDGLFILGEQSITPTSVAGAIMYSGSDYYLGF